MHFLICLLFIISNCFVNAAGNGILDMCREPAPDQLECQEDCTAADYNLSETYFFDLKWNRTSGVCSLVDMANEALRNAAYELGVEYFTVCKQYFSQAHVLRIGMEFLDSYDEDITGNNMLKYYKSPSKNISFPVLYDGENCDNINCGINAKCSTIFNESMCRCNDGFKGNPNTGCSAYCESRVIGNLTFGETELNDTAFSQQKCNFAGRSYPRAHIVCKNMSGKFRFDCDSLVILPCNQTITSVIKKAIKPNLTQKMFNNYAMYLQFLTVDSNTLNVTQVQRIIEFTNQTIRRSMSRKLQIQASTSLNSMALVFSQLAGGYWNQSSNNNLNPQDRDLRLDIAKAFPDLCLQSSLDDTETFELETNIFSMKRENIDLTSLSNSTFEYSPITTEADGSPVSLVIPKSAIMKTLVELNDSLPQTQRGAFIFYKDDTFFPSNQTIKNILSVNIGLNESLTTNFNEPVIIKHHNILPTNDTPIAESFLTIKRAVYECVFWDFNSNSWSSEGCCLNESSNLTECVCNHMTNFALLVKTESVPVNLALTIVSIIGCSLSIIGLLLTVGIMICKKELRKFRSAKMLMHLCTNIAISYLIFVVGVSTAVGDRIGCPFVTALVHYFFLVSWFWMAVYSFEMYISLVKVFNQYRRGFLLKCCIFAYAVPAIIVILTVGFSYGFPPDDEIKENSRVCQAETSSTQVSNYHADNVCWLKGYALYFGFLLPVALLLIYNIVVFCMVTIELSKKNSNMKNSRRTTTDSLIIAFTMTSIMGLTWLFGFLMLFSDNETYFTVMSWIFALSTASQGFAIFLLMTVRREDMRNVWWTPLKDAFGCAKKAASPEQNSFISNTVTTKTSKTKNIGNSSIISHTASTEIS